MITTSPAIMFESVFDIAGMTPEISSFVSGAVNVANLDKTGAKVFETINGLQRGVQATGISPWPTHRPKINSHIEGAPIFLPNRRHWLRPTMNGIFPLFGSALWRAGKHMQQYEAIAEELKKDYIGAGARARIEDFSLQTLHRVVCFYMGVDSVKGRMGAVEGLVRFREAYSDHIAHMLPVICEETGVDQSELRGQANVLTKQYIDSLTADAIDAVLVRDSGDFHSGMLFAGGLKVRLDATPRSFRDGAIETALGRYIHITAIGNFFTCLLGAYDCMRLGDVKTVTEAFPIMAIKMEKLLAFFCANIGSPNAGYAEHIVPVSRFAANLWLGAA